MTQDVQKSVLSWLEDSGFPLEMTAASAFRNAGFEVQQSALYADTQSTKGREIDVLAADPDMWGYINLSVVVECKSSTNPWVVLMSDDALQQHNILRTSAVMSDKTYEALSRRLPKIKDLNIGSHLMTAGRCGYGFRQTQKSKANGQEKSKANGQDPAYVAAMNVLSACKGVVSASPNYPNWESLAGSIPIIVVDSPLFECQLSSDGHLDLIAVQSSQFLFSAYLPDLTRCVIQVVHRSKLEAAATSAKSFVDALRLDLQPEQEELFAGFARKASERAAETPAADGTT